MPIPLRYCSLLVLLSLALFVHSAIGQPVRGDDEMLRAEVATARAGLLEHPKFKKYYEHLAANPDSLPVNGPKLAVLLAAEAKTSAAIKDHTPSLLATWQEVARLATGGNDYKTAFPAIDSLQKHPSGLLTPAAARLTKGKVLAAVAAANAIKPVPAEREALLELVRPLLKGSLKANDVAALPSLLASDAKLSWSTAESAHSIQLLLPLAQQAVDANRADAAKQLLDHLDALVLKTTAGKTRKDFADAVAAAREQLTIVESAQQSQQTLTTKPLDPAANQAYGMYLLTHRGQWRESLTYLALGTDADWKKLAADSLEVKTAADKVALADRWSALGKDENAPSKEIARHFYREALADKSLVGIARAATEEKAKSLGPLKQPVSSNPILNIGGKRLSLNEWTEIFPAVDFDQDVVRGFWLKAPNNTIRTLGTSLSRMRLPVLLSNCSYDLVVNVQSGETAAHTFLIIPVGNRNVAVVVDGFSDGKTSFFRRLGQLDGDTHKNAVHRDLLRPNSLNRFEINVRLKGETAHLSFSLNGKKEFDYEGPIKELNVQSDALVGTTAQPALGAHVVDISWVSCQIRVVDGTASLGRDVPIIKPIPPSILALKPTHLTALRPLSAKAHNDRFHVSAVPKNIDSFPPAIAGEQCSDYLFAHAPSVVTYAIPPKAKYFTAIAFCGHNPDLKFIVKVDGKKMFSAEQQSLAPVVVEIPDGAKVLQLECDSLGALKHDHSCWCFPAFRQ